MNSSSLVTNPLRSTLGRVFELFARISASFLTISDPVFQIILAAVLNINTDSCAEAIKICHLDLQGQMLCSFNAYLKNLIKMK